MSVSWPLVVRVSSISGGGMEQLVRLERLCVLGAWGFMYWALAVVGGCQLCQTNT